MRANKACLSERENTRNTPGKARLTEHDLLRAEHFWHAMSAAICHARAVRYAKHKEMVDKISRNTDEHFKRQQEAQRQVRLKAAERQREKEARQLKRQKEERERQALARDRAVELFARHSGGAELLGPAQLCALLSEALPQIGVAPPDAETVSVLLRRCQMEGITRATPAGEEGVDLPGVSTIILKYGDYLREQAVLDEAFTRYDLDGDGAMDGGSVLAMLRELAPERFPDDDDVRFVLRAAGLEPPEAAPAASGAAGAAERCRLDRSHMPRLLPALATWLRRGAAKAVETGVDAFTGADQPMQGEPVLVGQPAVAAAAATPSVPVRAPPQKTQSSACVLL